MWRRRQRMESTVDEGVDRFGRGPKREYDLDYSIQAFDDNDVAVSKRLPMRMQVRRDGTNSIRLTNVDEVTLAIHGNPSVVYTRVINENGELILEQEFVGPISTIKFPKES